METQRKRQRVASEVRATIARAGVKPTHLARAIGMAGSTMSRKLAGEASFTVDDLLKIAEELDVQLSELIPTRLSAK